MFAFVLVQGVLMKVCSLISLSLFCLRESLCNAFRSLTDARIITWSTEEGHCDLHTHTHISVIAALICDVSLALWFSLRIWPSAVEFWPVLFAAALLNDVVCEGYIIIQFYDHILVS